MLNPYGKKNGKLFTASKGEVERGLACNCVCPACGHKLVACQGKDKIDYFAHYKGSDCGAGYETALHVLAKETLYEEKKILIPELIVKYNPAGLEETVLEQETLVPVKSVQVDDVQLEKRQGEIIPDVIVKIQGKELLVEIKVTHGIDDKKKAYIRRNKLYVVEYDFSKIRGIVDKEHIKKVLTRTYDGAKKGFGRGEWINHPSCRKTLVKLIKQHKNNQLRKMAEKNDLVITSQKTASPSPKQLSLWDMARRP